MTSTRWHEPVPIALTKPILWAGVPWEWAALELMGTIWLVVYLHYLLFAPLFLVIHLAAKYWARYDPYFVAVAKEHLQLMGYYTA